jgi:hypothetical protein
MIKTKIYKHSKLLKNRKMKRVFTIMAALLMYVSVFAQAPQKMSYQSVIRNNSGALISNANVGVRISILQGSESGTAVYTETHTVTTNANGLASLQIGSGTPVTGTIGTVNWASGPFFVKTETDPTGGTSYSITGTSELLSVPYALYAANSAPGPQGPVGPAGPAGPEGPIGPVGNWAPGDDSGDMLYWDGTNWVNLPKGLDGQILTMCSGKPKWTKNGSCSPYYLGMPFGGGKIFYIDSTGEHGLIAATEDQGFAPWGCKGTLIAGTQIGVGSGQSNTTTIINGCSSSNTAAAVCANLVLNGYDDWFLPSLAELWILKTNQNYVGGFYPGEAHYWSSTEFNADGAWDVVLIWPWDSRHVTDKSELGQIRAIRKF